MKTDLQLSHIEVAPGQSGRISIDVTNNADVIDGVTAIIDGINPDWIRLERPLLSLFPDASDTLELVLDIPTTCPAGDYLVVVRIVSTIDADRQTVHDFWLTVTPRAALEISLVPQIVSGGSSATFAATVVNTGNTTSEPTIGAVDPTRELDCVAEPASVVIPQGHEALIDVTVRGKRPWFGDPVPHAITISARVDELVVEQTGTFRQKPRVPRGVLTALILASIILLWALIFLFVISELRSTEAPAKAVGTGFLTGPENIPLSQVAATAEGTVTAASTGDGIARITVEALRVNAEGKDESVGSAATDDDGRFSLQSLKPGTYKLRFSAEGYETVWYEAAGDSSTATTIELDPLTTREGLDVVLTGNLGVLAGAIAVPPDAVGVPLTVTASTIVTNPDGTTTTEIIAEATTIDGTFALTDLPTPGDYVITVTGPGFDTQQFEQTLAGGESTVVNTVNLAATTGSLEGTVRDGNGQPLGGVAITARSGDLVIRSVTPTTGNVGQFRIVNIPTPQTYALTFDLPQHSSTTMALSLGAGENRTGLDVALDGGSGTVSGVAVAADGTPVGGATVTVSGEAFSSETTTLTTSGAGGGAGSFTVGSLPVPGDYTISIQATGYQTETLRATFSTGAIQDFGRIDLVSSTSQVGGVVRTAGGGGIGGIRISLSDGTARVPTTTSATNPAGLFSFASTPPGSYTLTFEGTGYATKVVLVDVTAGVDVMRDVSLNPTSAAP